LSQAEQPSLKKQLWIWLKDSLLPQVTSRPFVTELANELRANSPVIHLDGEVKAVT
jgi:hypothetical protein